MRYYSGAASAPHLPDGAATWLTDSNERLKELAGRYGRLRHDAVSHSRWTDAYVTTDVPLTPFRSDCAYVWQHRDYNLPATYALTYYYLIAGATRRAVLDRLTEDDLFGAFTMDAGGRTVSRDLLDSVSEIAFLREHVPIDCANAHVLDIGSGYGRLAHRLVQASGDLAVSCVDAVARSTFLCEYYLAFRQVTDRAIVVPVDEIESHMTRRPVTVAVNIHSFSECTAAAVNWWLALLNRHAVPYLFVVPNPRTDADTRITGVEKNGSYSNLSGVFRANGYHLLVREAKFADPAMQACGVTPTWYYLFGRNS
jgi:hypothetical protein